MSSRLPEMLNMLHAMITEAWGVPLGAEKCVIDRDKALDILDEIRGQFPTEIAEAKRLLDARADFINNAKREAEAIKRTAEEQARLLIDDQEIIRVSRVKSNEMLSYAETSSNELRRAANEYVDDSMQRTEEALETALDEIKKSRQRFRQVARAAAETPPPAPPTEPPLTPRIDFDID
jgi:DNA mismatch repair ATPase MutS